LLEFTLVCDVDYVVSEKLLHRTVEPYETTHEKNKKNEKSEENDETLIPATSGIKKGKDVDYVVSENLMRRTTEPYETTHEKNEKSEENDETLIPPNGGIKKGRGGDRKSETIMMTVYTFKKFCMKACTKKADEIHDYYVKMEEMLQDMMKEESVELRNQLQVCTNYFCNGYDLRRHVNICK
jgi:hypothetical protein